jgi:restriction system protein
MPSSKLPGVKRPPKVGAKFLRFVDPLLDAMRKRGGQARPREIFDLMAQRLNLSEEERTVTNKNGYPRFKNEIAWARSYLVKTGYLDSPSRGIWRLTDKGKEAYLDGPDIDSIFQRVQEMNTLAKAGTARAATHGGRFTAPTPPPCKGVSMC